MFKRAKNSFSLIVYLCSFIFLLPDWVEATVECGFQSISGLSQGETVGEKGFLEVQCGSKSEVVRISDRALMDYVKLKVITKGGDIKAITIGNPPRGVDYANLSKETWVRERVEREGFSFKDTGFGGNGVVQSIRVDTNGFGVNDSAEVWIKDHDDVSALYEKSKKTLGELVLAEGITDGKKSVTDVKESVTAKKAKPYTVPTCIYSKMPKILEVCDGKYLCIGDVVCVIDGIAEKLYGVHCPAHRKRKCPSSADECVDTLEWTLEDGRKPQNFRDIMNRNKKYGDMLFGEENDSSQGGGTIFSGSTGTGGQDGGTIFSGSTGTGGQDGGTIFSGSTSDPNNSGGATGKGAADAGSQQ